MIGLEYVLKVFEIQQKDLAEELGIRKQNITLWLKGKQNISKKYLPILSEKFDLPEEYFQKEITEFVDYEEIKQYRAIGTVEEFKALKEKSIVKSFATNGSTCGNCFEDLSDWRINFCPNCGQRVN